MRQHSLAPLSPLTRASLFDSEEWRHARIRCGGAAYERAAAAHREKTRARPLLLSRRRVRPCRLTLRSVSLFQTLQGVDTPVEVRGRGGESAEQMTPPTAGSTWRPAAWLLALSGQAPFPAPLLRGIGRTRTREQVLGGWIRAAPLASACKRARVLMADTTPTPAPPPRTQVYRCDCRHHRCRSA